MSPCPSCAGPHMPAHPTGRLAYRHTVECPTLAAEDRTRLADDGRVALRAGAAVDRAATSTERALLAAQGATVPDVLVTRVRRVTPSIIERTWPALPLP